MADFETQNEVRQRQADAEAKALKAAQKAAGIHPTKSNKQSAVSQRAAEETAAAAVPAEAPGSKQSGQDAAGTAGGAFKETGGGNQMNVGAGSDSASTQRSAPSDRAHSSDKGK